MNDQVAEIKAKTDIVTIIGEHVVLKKAGRNFKGLCPFHSEKTPSFMVSQELQIYKCFGCGESGDVFTFLEKQEGMEFYEALRYLAERAGIKLVTTGIVNSESQELRNINEIAAKFYHYILYKHASGKEALDYLIKDRKLTNATIRTFVLGAAPESSNMLVSYLTKKRKFPINLIEKAGLVFRTDRGYVDRFRGRAVFPILDHRGNVIALAGRILPRLTDKGGGKYINSPETPIYHKSDSLYGLAVTKKDIKKAGNAIIVEGELDLLSTWQAGITNVVAIKGSALTEGQVKLISRFAKGITLALDTDFAGDNAAIKGIAIAQSAGLDVRVALLGKYKDPDEFACSDPEGFKKAISEAIDVWDFVVDVLFSRFNPRTALGKTKIAKELLPILAQIDDTIMQAHYIKLVASRLGVPFEAVQAEMKKHSKAQTPPPVYFAQKPKEKSRRELLEEQLLAIILQYDPLVLESAVPLIKTNLLLRIAQEASNFIKAGKSTAEGVQSLPEELRDKTAEIFLSDVGITHDSVKKEVDRIAQSLTELTLHEEMEKIAHLMSELENTGNKTELLKAKRRFTELTRELSLIKDSI
jgi:DNA primase